jgi:hypothetical protein
MAIKKLVPRNVISVRSGRGFANEPGSYRYYGQIPRSHFPEFAVYRLSAHWKRYHNRQFGELPGEVRDWADRFVRFALSEFDRLMAEGEPGKFYDSLSALVRCPACDYFIDLVIGQIAEGDVSACLDPWEDEELFAEFEPLGLRYGGLER